MENMTNIENIDPSLFTFVQDDMKLSDTKMATKRIGYMKDAFIRFTRNKASIAAAIIIAFLFLFAIFAPILAKTNYTETRNDVTVQKYAKLLPKTKIGSAMGFWDGTEKIDVSEGTYLRYIAFNEETNRPMVKKVYKTFTNSGAKFYKIKYDSYAGLGIFTLTITNDEYIELQKYQDENHVQLIYPYVETSYFDQFKTQGNNYSLLKKNANIWFETDALGTPKLDENGNY